MARQDNIPRGRTIPMGAVPVEARGLRHMAPTYLRRRPGSPSNGRLGSALIFFRIGSPLPTTSADPKAALRREALARRGAVASGARAAFSRRLADEGSRLARLWGPRIVSAFHALRDEPDTLELLIALSEQGFRDRPSCRDRPRLSARFSLVAGWRPDPVRRDVDRRASGRRARRRSRPPVRAARLFLTAGAIASAMAPAITIARCALARDQACSCRRRLLWGLRSRCGAVRPTTRAWTP